MRMMERKEFDAIYLKKLRPKQREVLNMWLEGKSDEDIGKSLYITESNVRHHISNICKLFGFKNEEGERFRQRDRLIPLFAQYKRELVSDKLKKASGISSDDREELNFYYVERHPIEYECYDKILEPGAVIRIKAPKYTGKTLLLNRILDRAKGHKYQPLLWILTKQVVRVFSRL